MLLYADQQLPPPGVALADERLLVEAVETSEKSKMSYPMAVSAAKMAFDPGMMVIANGEAPPSFGYTFVKFSDREPFAATSQTAR